MLVTKMTKTVTNILQLSPIHFVSNIRIQHQCGRLFHFRLTHIKLFQDEHVTKKREYFWKRSEDSIFGGHLPDYIN